MSYLYVTERGAVMGLDGGYYSIKLKDGTARKIPRETLESVALFGNISITTPCIQELLRKGIPISYFSERGAYFGRLESTSHKNIFRLKKQIAMNNSDDFSLRLAKKFISAKINNQTVVLNRYDKNKITSEAIDLMKKMKNKINMAENKEELIGYEGTAAKYYFSGLSEIIKEDFKFNKRNRRPPKDPFNSMLSLGYTLLMYEIYGEIENKGLTPYGGFLHKDHERHPTLASDLMEEWRSVIVDSVVLSLIQGNEISVDCFTKDEETEGVYLTKGGMSIFIAKYEKKLRSESKYINNRKMSLRRCLWEQVNSLTKAIEENNVDLYQPVFIR